MQHDASDVSNGGVSTLDGAGNVQHLHSGLEVGRGLEGGVALVDHDITDTRHVLLVKILDIHADVAPQQPASIFLWCISTVKILPGQAVEAVWVGRKRTSSPGLTAPCSMRPVSTSPTPLIL